MSKTKKLRLFAIVFTLIVVFALCLTGCAGTTRGELSIQTLNERIQDTINAQDYFINKTVYTMVDGGKSGSKQNKDYFKIQSSTKSDNRVYFWQDSWRYHLENDIALGINSGTELWWSNTYETISDMESKNAELKKDMTVWRDFVSAEKLEGGKKVADEEKSFNKADAVSESREKLMSERINEYSVSGVLAPYIELLQDENNYDLIDKYTQGSLDFYIIKVKDTYKGGIGERDENADLLDNFHLSELGQITITVINTEEYKRLTSITNTDDKESNLFYEMYFSYAAPPIAIQECAEKYVESINNPKPAEVDKTMMYVIIGLACGLGIPLVSLLIWFIIRKAKMFKDFDPDTMDVNEYAERYRCQKKGIPYVEKDKTSETNEADGKEEIADDITESDADADEEKKEEQNG